MNIISPAQVAANRTARLVSDAQTPVYSTATPVAGREHTTAVEIDDNGRFWSHMPDSEVDAFLDRYDGFVSDIDHSTKCWCQ